MIFINNDEIFSQNNGFDFVFVSCNVILLHITNTKITFPESGHSYLKVYIKERFMV